MDVDRISFAEVEIHRFVPLIQVNAASGLIQSVPSPPNRVPVSESFNSRPSTTPWHVLAYYRVPMPLMVCVPRMGAHVDLGTVAIHASVPPVLREMCVVVTEPVRLLQAPLVRRVSAMKTMVVSGAVHVIPSMDSCAEAANVRVAAVL